MKKQDLQLKIILKGPACPTVGHTLNLLVRKAKQEGYESLPEIMQYGRELIGRQLKTK